MVEMKNPLEAHRDMDLSILRVRLWVNIYFYQEMGLKHAD